MRKYLLIFLILITPISIYADWNDWEYNPLNPVTTFDYVGDSTTSYLKLDGSRSMQGTLDMDNNKIINLATPTTNLDAVNKSYCDSNTGSSVTEYIWGFNYNRDVSPFLVHTSSTVSTDAWEFNSNYDIQLKLSALADNAWGVDGNDDLYPK